MKKSQLVILLITSACNYIFACGGYDEISSYINDYNFSANFHINRVTELKRLAKHFYQKESSYEYPDHECSQKTAIRKDFLAACELAGINYNTSWNLYLELLTARKEAAKGKKTEYFLWNVPQLEEFSLYVQGIAEMHLDGEKTPPSWEKLLKLPSNQRKYRTSWVLYSLGNMFLTRNRKLSGAYYERLRQYVRDGGYDSQGLALASYRSDYIYNYGKINPVDWFRSILRCGAVGGNMSEANDYLRNYFQKKYPKLTDKEKRVIFHDKIAREVAMLYCASLYDFSFYIPYRFPEKEISMLKDKNLICADQIALIALYKGKEEICKKFLRYAPEDSLIKIWLEAKFARRAGHFSKSANLYRKWLKLFPPNKNINKIIFYKYYINDNISQPQLIDIINGEFGYTKLLENKLSEALYTFIKAKSWKDAAFVAEKLLSTNKLIEFCRNHCENKDTETTSKQLIHLLARRLLREYRFEEALQWYPNKEYREQAKDYIKYYRMGNNNKLSYQARAVALYNLAKTVKLNGKVLLATELDPDFYIWNCYSKDKFWAENWNWKPINLKANVSTHYNSLQKRWHYRYKAVGFWNRAAMMTDDPNLRAAALFQAFYTLRYLDAELAEWYYKALCDCRPNILAKRAWKRWNFEFKDLKISKELTRLAPLSTKEDFAKLFEKIQPPAPKPVKKIIAEKKR